MEFAKHLRLFQGVPGLSKRTRFEILATMLEVLKRNTDGCRITRLAYGTEIPNDRAKKYLETLMDHGLVRPLASDHRLYRITERGVEFLATYYKMISFFDLVNDEE
ncbi:MAG: winged helix-turn-helix domain-containing protein [Candidatus Heimdallarchaeota archaeon]